MEDAENDSDPIRMWAVRRQVTRFRKPVPVDIKAGPTMVIEDLLELIQEQGPFRSRLKFGAGNALICK
ncbi:hypothetical protein R1sor_009089 [Riccia sorocarpa]|uniref:Uncharacterized protein n=1 Tax=Riccia sorocarpa TaxID=122646 RepID=A0ABD3H822_9MARC